MTYFVKTRGISSIGREPFANRSWLPVVQPRLFGYLYATPAGDYRHTENRLRTWYVYIFRKVKKKQIQYEKIKRAGHRECMKNYHYYRGRPPHAAS